MAKFKAPPPLRLLLDSLPKGGTGQIMKKGIAERLGKKGSGRVYRLVNHGD